MMMQLPLPCAKPAHCSFFTYAIQVMSCWSYELLWRAGRIHLSARRSVEQLPFADTAFLSSNQSTHRRLIQPFKGHAFTTAKPKPQSKGKSNAGQGAADSNGAAEMSQLEQTPGTRGRPEEPAKESSTEGIFLFCPKSEVMLCNLDQCQLPEGVGCQGRTNSRTLRQQQSAASPPICIVSLESCHDKQASGVMIATSSDHSLSTIWKH